MVFGSLSHYLIAVVGRIQVEQAAPVTQRQFLVCFAGQHTPKHSRAGRTEFPSCFLKQFFIVEDESKPELVVASQQTFIKFLVNSMIKDDKLIFSFVFSGHQISTVSVGMHKAFLMNHFDYHFGKSCSQSFSIDIHSSKFIKFVKVHCMNELHNEDSICGIEIQLRNVNVFEVVLFEKMLCSPHVSSFCSEVQFNFDIFFKTFNKPLIVELFEQPFCHSNKGPHHLYIILDLRSQLRMLNLDCYFFPIEQSSSMNLSY